MPRAAGATRFLYGGKELHAEAGLDWHDFGARHYDPLTGRWTTPDPLAEKYYSWSPYAYCYNNPMRFVDPDGKRINDPNDYFDVYTGRKIGTDKDPINNDVRLISKDDWEKRGGANSKDAVEGSISLRDLKGYAYQRLDKNKILKEIGNNYYKEAGYNTNELENNSISLKDLIGAAETNYANKLLEIAINPRKFGSILNSKFDLINLFKHERGFHGTRFMGGEKWGNTPRQIQIWESEAYKGQISDPSWPKTSREFRSYIEQLAKTYFK